jgi:hypothetical protein
MEYFIGTGEKGRKIALRGKNKYICANERWRRKCGVGRVSGRGRIKYVQVIINVVEGGIVQIG